MTKHGLIIAAIGVATLAACGSKTDANAKNFGEAITRGIAKDDAICLAARKWPADFAESVVLAASRPGNNPVKELNALKGLGLVESTVTQADVDGVVGRPVRVVRYTPTEMSVPFFRQQEMKEFTSNGMQPVKGGKFCFARVALDKVVKWDEPVKLAGQEEVKVTYTYQLRDVADWAKRPEFAVAYPSLAKFIDGAGKMEVVDTLKKTSEGWESVAKR